MEYITFSRYAEEKFGQKVYKIALDGGFTCPNRDGTLGTGGCIFCSANGSGEFAQDRSLSVTEQIENGKKHLSRKIKDGKYIAYFQAFTGTYAPEESLRKLYEEAILHPDVVALSVATRPDCLPENVIRLLQEMNEFKPVWVELGLQTIHDKTAAYIRRGYALPVFDEAVKRLKQAGLYVIVHVILGLPGETREEMLQTVEYVGRCGADGIKLQLLHVLRGTDLEKDYLAGKFEVLTMEEYVELVADSIAVLPPDMVIHRMTGDGDKKILTAPLWSGDKKKVLGALQQALADKTRAGDGRQMREAGAHGI